MIKELEEDMDDSEAPNIKACAIELPRALDFELTNDDWYKSLYQKVLTQPESYPNLEAKNGKIFKTVED